MDNQKTSKKNMVITIILGIIFAILLFIDAFLAIATYEVLTYEHECIGCETTIGD